MKSVLLAAGAVALAGSAPSTVSGMWPASAALIRPKSGLRNSFHSVINPSYG